MINKKDYSLHLIQTVERLFTKIREFVNSNQDILELTKNDSFELLIEDKSKTSSFEFSISKPNQNSQNQILFEANYNPQSSVISASKKTITVENSIFTLVEQWTNLIRLYNNVNLTSEEKLINEYEKEFYENFEILDEDAETHPYDLQKQIIIHNYFVQVIQILKTDEESNKELIIDAEIIKDNIPKMTKKATLKSMSGFFAKVRKKSLPLLKELLDTGKKEIFKKAIKAGFEFIGELITLIG